MRPERHRFSPWFGKIPETRKWQPIPIFLDMEFHGQRSLAGYSPWVRKESDMTELTRVHHDPHPTPSGDHTQALWQAADLGGVTPRQALGLTPSARWRRGQGDAGRHLGPRERRGSEWSSHTGLLSSLRKSLPSVP